MPTLTTQQMLDEAKTALHKLMTGSMREEIRDANGGSVRYFPTDIEKLRGYIAILEAANSGCGRGGAIGVQF